MSLPTHLRRMMEQASMIASDPTNTDLRQNIDDEIIDRRHFGRAVAASLLWTLNPAEARPAAAPLADLERRSGGRLGVYAIDLATGRTLTYRSDERFKLMSTFKALLTAAVLREVAAGRERLDAPVAYGKADLLEASPVTAANVDRGSMSVEAMCAATMTRSDNAAANLLMRRLGGPDRLTALVRGMGDATTRIDNYEGHLTDTALPTDSTTPHAVVAVARRILLGPILTPAGRQRWETWMAGNVVGRARLRAAFPPEWQAGDRTGTGDGICNDVAFARRAGRAPLLVSAYHNALGMKLPEQEAVIREVGRLVVEWQR